MPRVNAVEQVAVHGNSLKSLRPTWGYKLYSADGTFLKNGITSKLIPETRYTKAFMSDKYMVPFKQFPNRLEAYQWEFGQNQILRGPLNSTWGTGAGVDYTVSNLGYDANGNIKAMKQMGLITTSSGTVDNLTYTYQNNGYSNKLDNVTNNGGTPAKLFIWNSMEVFPSLKSLA